MILLDKFQYHGLAVTPMTLMIGLQGPLDFEPLLSTGKVVEYAVNQLSRENDTAEWLLNLAIANQADIDEVFEVLNRYASSDSRDFEIRKWRVMLLMDLMHQLPGDPLYGLIRLTEFWAKFEYPADSPHTVQGQGNDLSPEEYFTEENFQMIVGRHREWISNELRELTIG